MCKMIANNGDNGVQLEPNIMEKSVYRKSQSKAYVWSPSVILFLGISALVAEGIVFWNWGGDWIMSNDGFGVAFVTIFGGIIILISIIVFTCAALDLHDQEIKTEARRHEEEAMALPNRMWFLKLIIQENPGVPMHEWNVIAAKTNDHLYKSGSFPDPHYFKDGKECFKKFKTLFLDSYSKAQIGSQSGSYDALGPYIAVAVEAYESKIKSYWDQIGTKE